MRIRKLDLSDENINGINLFERIEKLSKEIGLTQTDLAKKINISQSTIASWKTRNSLPPIKTLCIIADYFDISLDYLVRGHNFHNKNEHNIKNEIFSEIEVFKKRIELYL